MWCLDSASAQELRRSGFVGVQVVAIPDAIRAEFALPPDTGVLVQSLVEGGSARSAGVQPNDVITGVGDTVVTGVGDFVRIVRNLRAGDVPTLRIRRGGQTLAVATPIRPRPYEQSADAEVHYDAISVDGTLRRTIVTSPPGPGRHPALLYVNGIGCYSQESLDLSSNDARLLYGLTRAGYATMRVEKSGMGDSEGPACDSPAADFRAEVRSYTAGLRALKRYAFIDPDAIFIVGISVGGVEAPLIAAQEPVHGIVVINTVAKPFFEYLIDTRRRQMVLAHVPYDEMDRRMMLDERCNHRLLVDKQSPEAILATTPACADHISFPAPFTFVQEWADLNPAAAWKAVDRPVLVVYGTSDFVSTIADDPYLVSLINSFHGGTATLAPITGMDHPMNRAATMEESFARIGPQEFQTSVVEAIVAWLHRV
jgi:pimeloyl-ACP methyl ester carboxylesterase